MPHKQVQWVLTLGIAGIAIYTSSLKPEMLRAMMKADYPGTSISSLSFVLSAFVYVLIAFLRLFAMNVVFVFAFSPDSFVLEFFSHAFQDREAAKMFFMLFFLSIYTFFLIFAFSNLWSFVFNLYVQS
jgi:hypothetical protein